MLTHIGSYSARVNGKAYLKAKLDKVDFIKNYLTQICILNVKLACKVVQSRL